MAIVINGSGTVTGLSVGGLPDGTVDNDTVASGLASSKLTGALPAISGASLTGLTSSQMPTGSVLQTVTANILGTTTTTSSSFGSTVVAATITPSSTSSKILIMMNGGMNGFAGGSGGQVGYTKIYRGTTALESTTKGSGVFYFDSPDVYCNLSVSIEDSPSTTSATTYTLYAKRASGNGTFSINRDGNNHMHVILMEIAG